MSLTATQAEQAEWSDRRGDYWARTWTRTVGSSTLDQSTFLIQIRAGSSEGGKLIATSNSSEAVGGVVLISLVGCNVAAATPVIAWQIAAAATATIAVGQNYTIEAQCDRGGVGKLRTLFRHQWGVDPQTVRAGA